MRWEPGGRSEDLEDRRASGGGGGGFGGRGVGLGGLVILGILSLIFGRDFITPFLGTGGGPVASRPAVDPARDAAEEPQIQFLSFVLDDNQRTWTQVFQELNRPYRRARLVVFRDATDTGCGLGQAAAGPFYCPADERVYLDLAFYDELKRRFGAPGDFAQAYVVAHEMGHHIQNLLGIEKQVRRSQGQDPGSQNALSVRMELQADCFAGIWAHSTEERRLLDAGDVEEAMRAAAAVGDDAIQKMGGVRVAPESFTHGSSAQRMQWFRAGFQGGQVDACDTFGR